MFTDFQPNVCPDCGREFDSIRALASHSKVHSKDTECPICGRKVRYMSPHMKREHSEDPLYQLEVGFSQLIEEVRELRARLRDAQEPQDN